MKRTILATAFFLLIATLTLLVAFRSGTASAPDRSAAAEPSPHIEQVLRDAGLQPIAGVAPIDFRLSTPGGVERSLEDYRGSIVFLNFWATWCPPCVEEMPSMQRLNDATEGLVMVAVNVQEEGDRVHRFAEELGLTFEILLDQRGSVGQAYAVRGLPTTVLLNRDGAIIARKIGFAVWDTDEMIELFRTILDQV